MSIVIDATRIEENERPGSRIEVLRNNNDVKACGHFLLPWANEAVRLRRLSPIWLASTSHDKHVPEAQVCFKASHRLTPDH